MAVSNLLRLFSSMNQNHWMSSVCNEKKAAKTGSGGDPFNKQPSNSVSPWKVTPSMNAQNLDAHWDISRSHSRWVRVGLKVFEPNNAAYVSIRLFKPVMSQQARFGPVGPKSMDSDGSPSDDGWVKQGHVSLTLDELSKLGELFGIGATSKDLKSSSSQTGDFNRRLMQLVTGTSTPPSIPDSSSAKISSAGHQGSACKKGKMTVQEDNYCDEESQMLDKVDTQAQKCAMEVVCDSDEAA